MSVAQLRHRLNPGRRRPASVPVLAGRAGRAVWEHGRLGLVARRARPGAVPADREDLVPSSVPFPEARYVFLVNYIPEHPGGRSASILNRARLFQEHAGIDAEIVMTHFPGDLDRLTTMLRDRGALAPGVTLRRLEDDGRGADGGRDGSRPGRQPTRREVHAQLDRLVGDDRVFLTVESRDLDRILLRYRNPNVQQLYVLHNAHVAPPYRDPRRILRAYRPLMLQHADAGSVVFLTRAQRADMERVLGRQDTFFVIPHAVRPPAVGDPVERDPGLVVMLAHLKHQKRVEDAIAVFAEVVQRVPDARLEVYGHGPEEEMLQREIDRRGLGASVRLAGYTDEPGRLYQRAALSLLTSRHEGFPLVLLETLSSGCPPASYDVKYGPSELITHGVNGILVEEGDVSTMASEVIRVLTEPQLREELSRGAVASVDRLRPEALVGRWSALFNRLASTWGA